MYQLMGLRSCSAVILGLGMFSAELKVFTSTHSLVIFCRSCHIWWSIRKSAISTFCNYNHFFVLLIKHNLRFSSVPQQLPLSIRKIFYSACSVQIGPAMIQTKENSRTELRNVIKWSERILRSNISHAVRYTPFVTMYSNNLKFSLLKINQIKLVFVQFERFLRCKVLVFHIFTYLWHLWLNCHTFVAVWYLFRDHWDIVEKTCGFGSQYITVWNQVCNAIPV